MPTTIYNCDNITINSTSSIESNPTGIANNYYGTSCAANDDFMIIGAYGENNYTGAAYTCTYYNELWGLTTRLSPPNGVENGYFGFSCAISNYTIVIGAYGENSTANSIANNSGSVYIYTFDGSNFINTKRISSPNPVMNGYFGCSCAINGTYIVIGAMGENSTANLTANNAGVVYIYSYYNSDWNLMQSIKSTASIPYGYFGCSCAMTNIDIIIGAYGENSTSGGIANNSGAAYTSTLNNGIWSNPPTKLTNPVNLLPNTYFGCSCTISKKTIIISTISTAFTDNCNKIGAIYANYYNKTANFISSMDLSANILIVGGGGNGGGDGINYFYGGGGGGGQVLSGLYNFSIYQTYKINVGTINNLSSIKNNSGTILFLAHNGGTGGSINPVSSGKYIKIGSKKCGGGGGGPTIGTIETIQLPHTTQYGVNLVTKNSSLIGTASSGGNGGGYNYNYNEIIYGKGGLGAGLTSASSTIIPNTGSGGNANGGLGSSGTIIISYNNYSLNNTPLVSIDGLINTYNTFIKPSTIIPSNNLTSVVNIATKMNDNIPPTVPIPISSLNSLSSLNYVYTNS